MSVIRVADHGIVCASRKGTQRQSLCFPLICVSPAGRWLCAFRAAPAKTPNKGQHVLLTWSDDRGKSWHEPVERFVPFKVNGRAGRIRGAALTAAKDRLLAALCWVDYSDPDAPFFNPETEGLLDTKILLAHSDDRGVSWSEPTVLETPAYPVPTPLTGPILCLANGDLVCHFELNKHYNDLQPWQHSSVMMFSSDGGMTWGRPTTVAHDPSNRFFYWDQRPSVLKDGRLFDVFWTFDRQTARYINIHARQSTDSGRTWSEIWDTGVPGQPAPVRELLDGNLIMVYVDRTRDTMIKARLSPDGGRRWPDESESVLYSGARKSETDSKSSMQDAWTEMAKFATGLPDTAPAGDDAVLVVYYAGTHPDLTSIEWLKLTCK